MLLTTRLGRNVAIGAVIVPLTLWYIGFFGWTSIFFLQTVALCLVVAAKLTPPIPDPHMDPVTAACINKRDFLPGQEAPTHLTMVMYFDECPAFEDVVEGFSEAFSQYPRFLSVAVPKVGAAYESSWKKVDNLDLKSMFQFHEVKSEKELDEQIEGLTIGKLRPLDPKKPLWRIDVIKNANGRSVIIWILDHMFGDGIGLMPLAMSIARRPDGTPYEAAEFNPQRGGGPKLSLLAKITTVLKDFAEVMTIPTGPFDTTCCLNKNPTKPKLIYDGQRVVATVPDFDLKRITDIKNSRITSFEPVLRFRSWYYCK
eukprot:TRINITY_DN4672_c0_g1_i1.p1 TRINITY_DN4672_c0_g1~~TRINITY_DN4672_c0_g1_i1.p1  ORF type:complete len:313 (-),score=51.27 TRINITY_DN4672_c0_g1_i1:597-1535(-)